MKLSHQEHGAICVLTMSGECTADDVEQLRRSVSERITSGARHFLLDCEHLEFVDSAALECWLRLKEDLAGRGGQMRLVRPDDNVGTILRLTRLDRSFECHPTIESAVRSVR